MRFVNSSDKYPIDLRKVGIDASIPPLMMVDIEDDIFISHPGIMGFIYAGSLDFVPDDSHEACVPAKEVDDDRWGDI